MKGSTGSITVLILNFDREQDITWNEYDGQQFKDIESWIATADDDQGKLLSLELMCSFIDHEFKINGKSVRVENGIVPDVVTDYYEMLEHPIVIPARSYGIFMFRPW